MATLLAKFSSSKDLDVNKKDGDLIGVSVAVFWQRWNQPEHHQENGLDTSLEHRDYSYEGLTA